MSNITLYHGPMACSKVSLNALHESGLPFELNMLDVISGANKTPEYLAINPRGKVPALAVDGVLLTENAAILRFLHELAPSAHLLPASDDPLERARTYKDVVWCSATLHPMTRQIRVPMRYTDGETEDIRKKGVELFTEAMALIEAQLQDGPWWFGVQWSVVDVYLNWLYRTAELGRFSLEPYPGVRDHDQRVRARPSYVSALAQEVAAAEALGIRFPKGFVLT
ncbi:MAG: glutathione S-transferase family protein [Pseudomonadales bacterium]